MGSLSQNAKYQLLQLVGIRMDNFKFMLKFPCYLPMLL